MKQCSIQKEVLWRYVVGATNPKPINLWTGYGILLKDIEIMN